MRNNELNFLESLLKFMPGTYANSDYILDFLENQINLKTPTFDEEYRILHIIPSCFPKKVAEYVALYSNLLNFLTQKKLTETELKHVQFANLNESQIIDYNPQMIFISGSDISWDVLEGKINIKEYMEGEGIPQNNQIELFIKYFVNSEKINLFDKLIKESSFPMLGICGGHQRMYRAYGGALRKNLTGARGLQIREYEKVQEDNIFQNLSNDHLYLASLHQFEVSEPLPKNIRVLATKRKSPNAILRYDVHIPKYSSQPHLEIVSVKENLFDGWKIMSNFIHESLRYSQNE